MGWCSQKWRFSVNKVTKDLLEQRIQLVPYLRFLHKKGRRRKTEKQFKTMIMCLCAPTANSSTHSHTKKVCWEKIFFYTWTVWRSCLGKKYLPLISVKVAKNAISKIAKNMTKFWARFSKKDRQVVYNVARIFKNLPIWSHCTTYLLNCPSRVKIFLSGVVYFFTFEP